MIKDKNSIGVFIFLALLFLSLVAASPNTKSDRYIVKVSNDTNLNTSLKNKIVEEIKDPVSDSIKQIASARLSISKPKNLVIWNVDEKSLKNEGSIIYIEPDYIVKSLGEDNPWNFKIIGLDFSQIKETGKGVKIVILDTGSNNNNIASGYDFVNEDSNASDDNGHGTYISQILKSSDTGLPLEDAEIYSVKVLNNKGEGYVSDVIEGINWAVDNKINIVLMSFGGNENSLFLDEAIQNAYSHGILLIAASGNDGTQIITYPAVYNAVCSVGSIDQNLTKSKFSNYGNSLEFVAPGENISIGGNSLSGTSFSVPHVGIVAAHLFSENPTLNNQEIRTLLQKSTLDLGETGKDPL